MDEITLTKVGGIGQLSGWDQHGRHWVQCWADCTTRGLSTGTCELCGKLLTVDSEIWICSESGEHRCDDHIDY
jgi:hypothetical protein